MIDWQQLRELKKKQLYGIWRVENMEALLKKRMNSTKEIKKLGGREGVDERGKTKEVAWASSAAAEEEEGGKAPVARQADDGGAAPGN